MRPSDIAKQRVLGVLCVFCAVGMIAAMGRMMPYGLAGNFQKVRFYFTWLVVAFICAVLAGLGYYYYRNRSKHEDKELTRMRIEVDALSTVGQKPSQPSKPWVQPPATPPGQQLMQQADGDASHQRKLQ